MPRHLPLRTALPVLLLAVGAGRVAPAQDVPWLAEVTTSPPHPVLPQAGRIEPLLDPADTTPHDWQRRRTELRQRWVDFLGPMPAAGPLQLRVVRSEALESVDRRLVEYDGEPGLRVRAWLIEPRMRSGRLPALVALHQTTSATIDEVAGVSGPDAMQIGLKLARRGFVVLCPRCFLWQDVDGYDAAVQRLRERHPRTTGMAKMLYDARRAVDVLESLESVDAGRIGAVGHSLGGKEVLYLAAFDERVRAAVASEGGLGLRSTNWDAPWYLGPAIRDERFPLNHHQLLALIAPRPFLVLGGESGPGAADGDRSGVLINAALPAWRLSGSPQRLGLLNHREGHAIPDAAFDRIAAWLEAYVAAAR